MPSTYTPKLRLEQQADGENDTTWGDRANATFALIEEAIAGIAVISMVDGDYTLSNNAGQSDESRNAILYVQGSMTQQRSIIVPTVSKVYIVRNVANQDVSIKTAGGAGALIKAGTAGIVFCNGTDIFTASSPTSDGSIGPGKIDTSDAAWRLGSALGIGIEQALVPNYGVIHANGSTGSRMTFSVGGAPKGEFNALSTGLDIAAAPGGKLTFATGNTNRLTINSDGTGSYAGAFSFGSNTVTAGTGIFNNVNVSGVVTATGGFAGLTLQNVRSALTYTPVQQGTGTGQTATAAVKIGVSATQPGKVKLGVENTDYGNIMFEGTQGIFAPMVGSGGFEWSSNSPGVGFGNAVMIREVNRSGANGGNLAYAPAIGLHWSGQSAASIRLRPDAIISFINNPGTNYESIMAASGFFTGDVAFFYSDMRLKEKTGTVDNLRARARKLSSFLYRENALAKQCGYTNDQEQLGLSAQAVKESFPWCVKLAAFDMKMVDGKPVSKSGLNFLTVDYGRLSCVLFDVVNEQEQQIERLESQVRAHQRALTELMNRVSSLEAK